MKTTRFGNLSIGGCLAALLVTFLGWPLASAQSLAPAQSVLGGGLEQLVRMREAGSPKLQAVLQYHITSPEGDVLVDLHLQPGVTAQKILPQLTAAGFRLQAISELNPSLVEGYVSLDSARSLGSTSGVKSVLAAHRAMAFAGRSQNQAVTVEKADLAQARGWDGTGIRIGVLSDSYDEVPGYPTAADDVANDDLPKGVVVLQDGIGKYPTDEGRLMMQLIHDVAPGAQLGFATGEGGLVNFSNNMLALRHKFHADIIVDDYTDGEEPMYSDGLIAQTVDQLASEGVACFSATGNSGSEAYEDDYRPMSFRDAQKLVASGKENIRLDELLKFTGGVAPVSVQTFRDAGGRIGITQKISNLESQTYSSLWFQWDEPFDLGKVKTDFDLLIFDENGHFISPFDPAAPAYYTADRNIATDEPFEFAFLGANSWLPALEKARTNYQIVIVNWNGGPARHVKYIQPNAIDGFSSIVESAHQNAPSVWGHAAARRGQGVAAMNYAITRFPEDYSSPGPVTIYLDGAGNRLAKPEIRQVPQITAVDGVDTSYPLDPALDIDGTGFYNFYGSSAAAPNAAAVAALVLQSAGGPGSLKPEQLYQRLQRTATPVPLSVDRVLSGALAGPVIAAIQGDLTYKDDYFSVAVLPITARSVTSVSITLNKPKLLFAQYDGVFTLGETNGISPADIKQTLSPDYTTLTLSFPAEKFRAGDSVSFGMPAYDPLLSIWEVDADRFEGAVVKVVLDDGSVKTGSVVVAPKLAINRYTGAGLVNADAATRWETH